MSDFIAMGGYGWYVWMSYGACAIALATEIHMLRARRRRARADARIATDEALTGRAEAAR
jgi:heme exporter protein D